ncbi:magnesium-translocating P-type ATPase, partial [Escherichia coli]|nr:magnesium-translocating P-type ATPase [Escherichia coli]
MLICKGAVEEMLSISTHVRRGKDLIRLGDVERKNLAAMARAYNEDGFRVLVVATRGFVASEAKTHYAIADEADLTIQGFLTFLDPPKETAGPAI